MTTSRDGIAEAKLNPRIFHVGILLLIIPAVKLLVHVVAINGYGLGGDELYYIACSNHLDWGYVDHLPLSIFLLHVQRLIFGNSELSIRMLSALAGFFTVLLTGFLARRMGAGIFGQLLAQVCALVAPVYLALNHIYSMNAFDLPFWLAAVYLIVRLIDGGKPVLWLWFGVVMGLGFENKISVLFLAFGLAAGLLLTKQRRLLFSWWVLIGAGVALFLMVPNIIWQITHGWPTIEWIDNARAHKMVALSPQSFLSEQFLLMQPLTVLVWGTGLISLFLYPALSRYRALGWCYIAIFILFVVEGGKPYYLAPIYPPLFAAGTIVIEKWLSKRWMRIAVATVLLVAGAATAPLGMPLLPVESSIGYSRALGLRPASGERSREGELPSFFSTMLGWKKLAADVDRVYRSLPPEDRRRCGFFCWNYMQAGAIDFYGRQYGLPHAICGHNNYWLWGLRGYTGDVLIVLGGNVESLQKYFGEVSERARFHDRYIQPMQDNLPIFVVRRPKQPLSQLWPMVKEYI